MGRPLLASDFQRGERRGGRFESGCFLPGTPAHELAGIIRHGVASGIPRIHRSALHLIDPAPPARDAGRLSVGNPKRQRRRRPGYLYRGAPQHPLGDDSRIGSPYDMPARLRIVGSRCGDFIVNYGDGQHATPARGRVHGRWKAPRGPGSLSVGAAMVRPSGRSPVWQRRTWACEAQQLQR